MAKTSSWVVLKRICQVNHPTVHELVFVWVFFLMCLYSFY